MLFLILVGGMVFISVCPILLRRAHYRRLYATHKFSLSALAPAEDKAGQQAQPLPFDVPQDATKLVNVSDNLEYQVCFFCQGHWLLSS